jgi:hypothetical protein
VDYGLDLKDFKLQNFLVLLSEFEIKGNIERYFKQEFSNYRQLHFSFEDHSEQFTPLGQNKDELNVDFNPDSGRLRVTCSNWNGIRLRGKVWGSL